MNVKKIIKKLQTFQIFPHYWPAVFLLALACSMSAIANQFQGRLLERGTKNPIEQANIYLLPFKLKTVSDKKGVFQFENIPEISPDLEGELKLVVNMTNYLRLEKNLRADFFSSGVSDNSDFVFYLERESYNGSFETTILGQKSKKDASAKVLTQKEFLTVPGANGDPVKAVQNFPGVNRVNGLSSQVVIQGSAPEDTTYAIEGHKVPIIFHFGGLSSVVMPESVESVDYLSAGFGPEFSRVVGGIISLKTKTPDPGPRDSRGFYFIDNLKSGIQWEGRTPQGDGFLIAGRYSYVGLFLRQILKDQSDFNLTVAPEFADLTVLYSRKLNETDELKLTNVASRDIMEFLLKQPANSDPSVRGTFTNETSFVRFIPQWKRSWGDGSSLSLSAGLGQDKILIDIGQRYFRLNSYVGTLRGEWEKSFSSTWKSFVGVDNEYGRYQVALKLPNFRNEGGVRAPTSSNDTKEDAASGMTVNAGVYWKNELKNSEDSSWIWIPSLRADRLRQTHESLLSPRLTAKWLIDESFKWRYSIGQYYQRPSEQQGDSQFGNPQIKSGRARHWFAGFEKDFRGNSLMGWSLSSGYFRRDFDNLVVSSSAMMDREGVLVPENYNNTGKGLAHGVEFLLKGDFNPISGWLSYTLSRSTRQDPSHSEYVYPYDQTHNINLVVSYDFPRDYKLSGRYRFVTGNPLTPITGATFDADNDVYVPQRGDFYSQRLSAFQQLDLRLDKKFIADLDLYTVYIDIQNVLNSKNTESVNYSYDYSQRQDITGLPLLASFGFKGEF